MHGQDSADSDKMRAAELMSRLSLLQLLLFLLLCADTCNAQSTAVWNDSVKSGIWENPLNWIPQRMCVFASVCARARACTTDTF